MEETVTCSITLYQLSPEFALHPEKNFYLEGLYSHIDDFCNFSESFTDQRISRQGLEFTWKVALPEAVGGTDYNVQAAWIRQDYNYAKVHFFNGIKTTLEVNNDIQKRSQDYYCYITSMKEVSKGVIEVSLKVDTLNTFMRYLTFSNKCHIVRQHKDRYAYSASTGVYKEKIDRYPEGLEANLFRVSSTVVGPDAGGMQCWYLSYSTKNDLTSSNITNPVSVKVIPQNATEINQPSSNTVTSSTIVSGKHYLVYSNENPGGFFEQYSSYILGSDMPNNTNEFVSAFDFYSNGNYVRLTGYRTDKTDGGTSSFLTATSDTSLTLSGISKVRIVDESNDAGTHSSFQYAVTVTEGYLSVGSSPSLASFSDYDRSDSKLMKIIELPYAPFQETLTSGKLDIPSGFSVRDGYLYAESTDTEFGQRISAEYKPFDFTTIRTKPVLADVSGDPNEYDPKIHHSDFYSVKFVYDSYSTQFRMEDMIPNSDTLDYEPYVDIYFKATNTINSKFLFTVKPANTAYTYYSDQDYPMTILAARNNEKTIFTNDYLNYIRTGYNYDLKKNNASITASVLSSAVSIGGGLLASVAGGSLGAAIGIGAVASGVGSAISVINSAYQNDNSMKSKLQTLAFQSTGVSGSDDLDLFRGYNTQDKLRVMIYQPRSDVISMLEKLWFYYGYKCNDFGKPDIDSRYWFNFVQGDMDFYVDETYRPPRTGMKPQEQNGMDRDMASDLHQRFTDGVTVFHWKSYTLSGTTYTTYNIYQNKENMEMAVYNQLTA